MTSSSQKISTIIKKLKLECVYYFKIQARVNRSYGASSPTIIFRTPNAQGENGGKIFKEENEKKNNNNNNNVSTVLLSNLSLNKTTLEMNMIWIITASVSSLFILFIVLLTVFVCKRAKNKRSASVAYLPSRNRNSNKKRKRYDHNKDENEHELNDNRDEYNENDLNEAESSSFQKQQHQQLLVCNGASGIIHTHALSNSQNNEPLMPTNQIYHLNCSNSSNASTLLKHQHQHQRTPNHLHHHQALVINNPNHMMMTLINSSSAGSGSTTAAAVAGTNHSNANELDFYSNMTNHQIYASGGVHTGSNNPDSSTIICINNNEQTCYQHVNMNGIASNINNMRCSSLNEENNNGGVNMNGIMIDLSNDMGDTSAALAAANAAFNAPISNALGVGMIPQVSISSSTNNNNLSNLNNDSLFLRHTIRPKPIAIPINSPNTLGLNSNANNDSTSGLLVSSASHRKSFKNLRKFKN
jgi:hypothetical protein